MRHRGVSRAVQGNGEAVGGTGRIRTARYRQNRQLHPPHSCVELPGEVPVQPPERGPDHRALVPAAGDDLTADRLCDAAEPLAHHCRLTIPRSADQVANTVVTDTDFGMIAEVD